MQLVELPGGGEKNKGGRGKKNKKKSARAEVTGGGVHHIYGVLATGTSLRVLLAPMNGCSPVCRVLLYFILSARCGLTASVCFVIGATVGVGLFVRVEPYRRCGNWFRFPQPPQERV